MNFFSYYSSEMLVLLLIVFGYIVDSQGQEERALKYEIKPQPLNPDEKPVSWKSTPSDDFFGTYKLYSEYVGWLWAGKTEFPWVVELEVYSPDREFRGVGLFANADLVITTCYAIDTLLAAGRTQRENEITVVFTDMNLNNSITSRHAKEIVRHPSCQTAVWPDPHWPYDVAAIILDRPVREQEPQLKYMHRSGYESRLCEDHDASCWEKKEILCYVVSFGKPYANVMAHLVLDFKVKFRAYPSSWETCKPWEKYVCKPEQDQCKDLFKQYDKKVKCFRTKALVGTVCDHDRGAVVMCNRDYYGFLARGALAKYCSNRFPIPFFVNKLDPLRPFLRTYEDKFRAFPQLHGTANALSASGLLPLLLTLFSFEK